MTQAETKAKLVALHKTVGRTLEDARARYFDPALVLELFQRWTPVREALRSEFKSTLGDLPIRNEPLSSGTADHNGRGYITRQPIEQLHSDTGGPTGELLVSIHAWMAKQERRHISERIKAGLTTVRAKGKILGRPREITDAQMAAIREHRKHHTIRAVASLVGVGVGTVERVLASNIRPRQRRWRRPSATKGEVSRAG